MAIATGNTEIIANSVIVLFVMDLDEYIFASLKAWNKKWTAHACDSESSSAEKEGAIEEMKEEIAVQKVQIASQQEELDTLRSQQEKAALKMDEMIRQTNEIAMLRETVQKLLESQAPTAGISSESTPQCNAEKSLTTYVAKSEDTCSDVVARERERMNTVEDETSRHEGQIIAPQHGVAMPCDEEQKEEES